MEQAIKPIETHYKGYRFRSRLEARWAVFFDAIGIRYLYEPEGFRLSDGTLYLPDFYLPESKAFFEVKGVMNEIDMHKIEQFIKDSKRPCIIGYDDFTFNSCDALWEDDYALTDKSSSVLVRCRECGKMYFSGMQGSYVCQCCGAYDGDHYFEVQCSGDHSFYFTELKVKNAIDAARQARFEHGETPQLRREGLWEFQ